MVDCFERAAARHRVMVAGREHVARVEARVERDYEPLAVADDARIVRLVRGAAARLATSFKTRATGAASDANVFGERGLEVANLGCGMRQIHTVNEWVDINDIIATTALLIETVRLHR
jgi:tripeptide aminopeptidase